MKPILIFLFAFGSQIACSSNNAAEAEKVSVQEQKSTKASTMGITQIPSDDIVGYWKLSLEAYDENENKILDEDERKKGIKNKYTYRFNADGSCQIQETFRGTYKEKTEKGHKMLYVYRNRVVGEEDRDPVPDVYRIISMSKTQLVLLEQEGNLTFWVFERSS